RERRVFRFAIRAGYSTRAIHRSPHGHRTDMRTTFWGAAVAVGLTAACGGGTFTIDHAVTSTIGPCDAYLGPQLCAPSLCGNDHRNVCGTAPAGSDFCSGMA